MSLEAIYEANSDDAAEVLSITGLLKSPETWNFTELLLYWNLKRLLTWSPQT